MMCKLCPEPAEQPLQNPNVLPKELPGTIFCNISIRTLAGIVSALHAIIVLAEMLWNDMYLRNACGLAHRYF